MLTMLVLLAAAEPTQPASLNLNAGELFERDADLKRWALKAHDSNGDGWLTLYEAQPAMREFKQIADADRDGRVSVREYREAKAFLAARFGASIAQGR